MPPRHPRISARKQPVQDRSRHLLGVVLEAAIRILRDEGAKAFTMARVAEKAGVSVGSLYQYFPNKEAILFRLQTDEWQETMPRMAALLMEDGVPAPDRLRRMIRAFFQSECEEALFRKALADAAPLYRQTAEAQAQRERSTTLMIDFLRDMLPDVGADRLTFAADLVLTSIAAIGKQVSEAERDATWVAAMADATGDMLCGWLAGQRGSVPP